MPTMIDPRRDAADEFAVEALALDANPLPAWIFDRESFAILAVNSAAVCRYGYDREEFLTLSIRDLRAPEDVPQLLAFLPRVGEEGTNPTRWRHRTKDGTSLEVEIVWHPLQIAGRPALLVLALDASDRAAAADEAQRAYRIAERLRRERQLLLDAVAEGVVGLDARGLVSFVNPAATQLLGYRADELMGRNLHTLVHDRYPDGSLYPIEDCPIWRAFQGGYSVHLLEETLWRKDDTPLPVLTSVAPILQDGVVVGGVAVIVDATEWRAREELRHEVLAHVAHDLMNPLTAIKVQAQLLGLQAQRERLTTAALASDLAHIVSAADRATHIVDELLDAARVRLGHPLKLQLGAVDLVALVQEAVVECQATTTVHQITLQSAEASLVGQWDGARLERVIDNLLANGVKYSPNGGPVVVSIAQEADSMGRWAVLAVRDEGVGIPAADLPNLFERFHRGSNVAGIAGSGIGLVGARQIITQHGGTIAVTSVEGAGSTFTIRLPLDPVGNPPTS